MSDYERPSTGWAWIIVIAVLCLMAWYFNTGDVAHYHPGVRP